MSRSFFKIILFFLILSAGIFGVGRLVSTPVRVANADANPGTNITSTAGAYWAWNDVIGWMNFHYTHTITVNSQGLTGYASSSIGDVSLDCHTTSIGNICGTSSYQVLNDGAGHLSGWGWNDKVGWISFCGGQNTTACPNQTVSYQVNVDANIGDFSGWAWNDLVGWLSFNCTNVPGSCSTSSYKVQTSWIATSTSGYLDSTTYDTGVSGGANINSITWKGATNGGAVNFQFAVSNSSSGPWSYVGPNGASTYYTTMGPGYSLPVDYSLHNNKRYFRYRAYLVSDQAQRNTPRVDDIIVDWSL